MATLNDVMYKGLGGKGTLNERMMSYFGGKYESELVTFPNEAVITVDTPTFYSYSYRYNNTGATRGRAILSIDSMDPTAPLSQGMAAYLEPGDEVYLTLSGIILPGMEGMFATVADTGITISRIRTAHTKL